MQKYKQKLVCFFCCFFRLISIIFIINYAFLSCGCKQKSTNTNFSVTNILFFSASPKEVTTDFTFVGHTEPNKTVNIVSRITGTLTKINFDEGNKVKQDSLLFEIDPIPYKIILEQAIADLAGKLANETLSKKEYERSLGLYKSGNLSESKLDIATKQKDYAAAIVKAAEEEVKKAKLNLSYTKILAPFDGIIGESKYSSGNLISPESGCLATLVDTSIIQVRFYIKEKQVLQFLASGNDIANLSNNINIDLLDPNTDKTILQQGKLTYVSPTANKMSAMLTAKAEFINNNVIVPGMYVKLLISKKENVSKIFVPKTCVIASQLGKFVWVMNDENKAQKRYIKTQGENSNFFIVQEGLTKGDKVIVEGIQKVYQDAVVAPTEVTIDKNTATVISPQTR